MTPGDASEVAASRERTTPEPGARGGIAGTFAASGLTAAAGFVAGIVVARALGPHLRGELASVVVWTTLLATAGDFGIGFAVSYVVGRDRRLASEAWTQAMLWAASLGAVLAVGAVVLVPRTVHGQTTSMSTFALGFSAIPFMLGASYQSYLLLGMARVAEGNWVRLVAGVGYAAGVVACAATGHATVGALVLAFWVAQVAAFLLATALVVDRARPTWRLGRATGIEVLRHGVKTQVASVAAQATLRVDQLVLAATFPPEALGLYAVAVALASGTGPIFSAGAIVAIPHVSAAAHSGGGSREVVRFLKLTALVGLPLVVVGVVVTPWVLPLLFGKAFSGANTSAQILLVAGLFQGWNAILGNGLRALGRPGSPAIAETMGLVLTGGLLFVLLPRFGTRGAAIASLTAYAGVATIQLMTLASGSGQSLARLLGEPLGLAELLSRRAPVRAVGRGP